jgi:hypothetical protein
VNLSWVYIRNFILLAGPVLYIGKFSSWWAIKLVVQGFGTWKYPEKCLVYPRVGRFIDKTRFKKNPDPIDFSFDKKTKK